MIASGTVLPAAAVQPATDLADLKRKSVRGGMTTMASQGISVVIQLTSTVILARLLTPEDYGIIAMVVALTAFAGIFRDLGLSAAAIQKKDLTRAQQSNLFWLNVAMGALLTGLVAAGSPLVAWFYGRPELVPVSIALSFGFLLGSSGTQHGARLVREMQFGRQAIATISGSVLGLAVSITLALGGFSYWALVWGSLCSALSTTVLLFILSPFRPGLPSKGRGVRDMLKFGAHITAFDFANYFHRNLDTLLIGRFWGTEALGLYSRAYALLMFPIHSLRGPINAVGFPALSRLQNQPEAYRAYYQRLASLLALVSMPLTAFLFVAAKPIIALALGPQWSEVAPVFAILAAVGFVQPVITLWGMVLLSRGLGRRYLHLGIFNTFCSVIGFAAGLPLGPVGVAAGYAVVTYVTAYPILAWAFRDTPLCFQDFLTAISRPVVAATAAAAASVFLSKLLPSLPSPILILFVALPFGAIYLATLRVLPGSRDEFRFLRSLAHPVLTRIQGGHTASVTRFS